MTKAKSRLFLLRNRAVARVSAVTVLKNHALRQFTKIK